MKATSRPNIFWNETQMFQQIPLDVLIHIMSYTSVLDIIALRQVCRLFLVACYQRILWIDALRTLFSERNLLLHSFPISDMTLPQLEHAATASVRFLALMRRDFSQNTAPFSTRILSNIDSTERFKNMDLVPDGHFLLSSCGVNVRLWNLGFHLGSSVVHLPLAFITLDRSFTCRVEAIQSSANAHEILVLVISRDSAM
ncbi:hypothetical protein DFH07DRAFT_7561 [Mycena maculata]|uniref:F-box domain-containing protein n=1 Tax=Mycena maculata TaxID=230809 RepID=A0AAD7KGY9_9AGAR|nr:hypothetical protein DFH07DRAFT_7561 [Mycena maculata]